VEGVDNMINKINNFLLKCTKLCLIKPYPKHSIRFAKKYFKGKIINAIEIGTFEGKNAKDILNNLNINKLYLIDPYNTYTDNSNEYKDIIIEGDKLKKIENIAKKRLNKYENHIIWIKECSNDAINKVPFLVEFIYIDGNHSYQNVLNDCKNYWKKVKRGGILAGHDISMVEVLNAVQDFCKENNLHFQVAGQDWWITKLKKVGR